MLQVFEQINNRAFNSVINSKLYLHIGYVHLLLYFNLIAFYAVRSIQFHSHKSHFSGVLNLNFAMAESKRQWHIHKQKRTRDFTFATNEFCLWMKNNKNCVQNEVVNTQKHKCIYFIWTQTSPSLSKVRKINARNISGDFFKRRDGYLNDIFMRLLYFFKSHIYNWIYELSKNSNVHTLPTRMIAPAPSNDFVHTHVVTIEMKGLE